MPLASLVLDRSRDLVEGIDGAFQGDEGGSDGRYLAHHDTDFFQCHGVFFTFLWIGACDYVFVKGKDGTEGIKGYEASCLVRIAG